MILGHPLGETLDVGIFRFLSDLAEFDLSRTAGRCLPDKSLVSWSSTFLAEVAAAWLGCPVWAKIGEAASSPTATTTVVVSKQSIMATRERHLATSSDAFRRSSLLPKLPMRHPRYPQYLRRSRDPCTELFIRRKPR
jgi:hypothetical protein